MPTLAEAFSLVSKQSGIQGSNNPRADLYATAGEAHIQQAKNDIIRAGLTSLLAGGSIAGLQGLWRRFNQPKEDEIPGSLVIDVPVHQVAKRANNMNQPANVSSKTDWAPYLPLMGTAVAGGLGLGYVGTKDVIDKMRLAALEKKLRDAREKYEQTLLSQYSTGKAAAAENEGTKLGGLLDQLFEQFEGSGRDMTKTAFTDGQLAGVLAAYALAAGVPAAYLGYRLGSKASPGNTFRKALKRRELMDLQRRPPEIFARPVPDPVSPQDDEDSA